MIDGKQIHLGNFDKEEEAASAYNERGILLDPTHFRPNIIKEK